MPNTVSIYVCASNDEAEAKRRSVKDGKPANFKTRVIKSALDVSLFVTQQGQGDFNEATLGLPAGAAWPDGDFFILVTFYEPA